jgi:hypothetical protein
MATDPPSEAPIVPIWQLNVLRLFYLLIGLVMGSMVWSQILFAGLDWPIMTSVAKSMLAGLALLCLLGLRYPLKMLPLLLYEMAWKTVWIGLIAYPAWSNDRASPDMVGLFWECAPVAVMYLIMPWRYIWHHYAKAPMDAWRGPR